MILTQEEFDKAFESLRKARDQCADGTEEGLEDSDDCIENGLEDGDDGSEDTSDNVTYGADERRHVVCLVCYRKCQSGGYLAGKVCRLCRTYLLMRVSLFLS
jgi:hypothetical protein